MKAELLKLADRQADAIKWIDRGVDGTAPLSAIEDDLRRLAATLPDAQPEPVSMTPRQLAERIEAGERWKLADEPESVKAEMEQARVALVRVMVSPNLYDYADFTIEYRHTILKALEDK